MTPTSEQLRRVLNRRNLFRYDVAKALNVSLATASRYLADPLLLDGYQRQKLAELLGVTCQAVDRLLAGAGSPLLDVDKKRDAAVPRTDAIRTFEPETSATN
jgi:predicted transcriptional regulator